MDILNLLLHSGYLKYEGKGGDEKNRDNVEVSIPNEGIKKIYDQSIEEWIEKEYGMEELEESKKFLKSLCEGEEKEIKERLEIYLNKRSIFDVERVVEMGYHNFLFGLLQGLEGTYLLESNKGSGVGRFDIMLTPIKGKGERVSQKKGVVIELKIGEKGKLRELSRGALKQIEEKGYYKSFEGQGLEKAKLVGIAFYKKEAEVTLKEIDFKGRF